MTDNIRVKKYRSGMEELALQMDDASGLDITEMLGMAEKMPDKMASLMEKYAQSLPDDDMAFLLIVGAALHRFEAAYIRAKNQRA